MELLIDFILVTGIVIVTLVFISTIKKWRKEMFHKVLALLFIIVLFQLIGVYGFLHRIKSIWLISYLVTESMGYLIGPLIYLYIKSLYHSKENFFRKHWMHYITAALHFIVFTLPIFLTFLLDKEIFSYLTFLNETRFPNFDELLQGCYIFVYIIFSLRIFKNYKNALKFNFSNFSRFDLNWINFLLFGALIVSGTDILSSIYELVVGELNFNSGYITAVFMVLLVLFLAYYGSSRSQILLPDFILEEVVERASLDTSLINHHLSNATNEEIENLKTRLEEVLNQDKPYLDDELTLGMLAEMIPTTDKKLSALINHHLDNSFYNLINEYRVEEVKSKMADTSLDHYTLLSLGYDSGFKSKTSFNRIFKKSTGLSPSEYKKREIK